MGAKFSLERMEKLLAGLGHPEHGQRFVHVAGTNGKGSTCAIIASVLLEAGFRTGLYTSPHLVEPTERIQIDGYPITDSNFAAEFDTVHTCAERMLQKDELDAHPSYFETVTAMALLHFKERCEISVIEVGLGGRLDATNVITPELCVITPIAYDHEAYLGPTLESIAAEKAGILKPTIPAVIAPQFPAADSVIDMRARGLLIKTQDTPLSNTTVTAFGSQFTLHGEIYDCPLAGRHQIENAKTAIIACEQLGVSTQHIQAGLKNTRWPGRLEFVARIPDIVLDGAHNPAGAAALAAYIREFCSTRPVWLIYSAMRDKAIEEVTNILFPLAEKVVVTAPNVPRALRPEAVLAITPHPNAIVAPTVLQAVQLARAAPPETIVFFAGSLFLIGEARPNFVE